MTGKVKWMSTVKTKQQCMLCDGARDSFIVFAGHSLCFRCEAELVNMQPGYAHYDRAVRRFGRFWHTLAEAAATDE